MMDVPDYAEGIRHKKRIYQTNDIPVLFVYPEDLKGPNWPETLYHRIEEAGQQALRRQSAYISDQAAQPYR